jgi:hypothetical protein
MRWLKRKHLQYLERVRDPILADRSLDLMTAAFWLCIAGWGISSAIAGLPAIGQMAGKEYELFWGGILGIVCGVAFTACISTFYITPNIQHRITRKRVEMTSGSLAGGLIAVYPALVILAVIEGDSSRISAIFLALSFLIVPTWRVRHLYGRIRKLREVASMHTGEVKL